MELIERGSEYYRVADPDWPNPLDGSYSMKHGGRWNAPESYPVVYLSRDLQTARANARRFFVDKLVGTVFRPSDLEPTALPVLVTVELPTLEHLDVVTDAGIVANGLPPKYPLESTGQIVDWSVCQPVGQQAWSGDLPGVACRSAAGAPNDGEELAWFERADTELTMMHRELFDQWYGTIDW